MGQNQIKAGLVIQQHARSVVDQITSRFPIITGMKSLTYDQFIHEVQLLNEVTDELTKDSDKSVHFSIQEGRHKNFMWKVSTKVACEKVVRNTGTVLTSKLLSVRRFLRLYADIMHQLSAVSSAGVDVQQDSDQGGALCASMIIDGLDTASIASDISLNECCICMDSECDVILPCAHGFCEHCINQWKLQSEGRRANSKRDGTCPLCRNPLEDASHHWVLPETGVPQSDEMPALVLGLVDRAEGRTSTHSTSSCDNQDLEPEDNSLRTDSLPDGFTLVSHDNESEEPQ